jgi:hypothetical protein
VGTALIGVAVPEEGVDWICIGKRLWGSTCLGDVDLWAIFGVVAEAIRKETHDNVAQDDRREEIKV